MVNWRALFCRPPKRTTVSQSRHSPLGLATTAETPKTNVASGVPLSTNGVVPQQALLQRPTMGTDETTNKLSKSFANGLELALRLLKEAVTGIGVPGLEAAVSGVVKVIDIIENVRDNKNDIEELSRRISSVAEAIGKSTRLHLKEDVSELLRLRMEAFLKELELMLLEVKVILNDRNLASRTANSQAYSDSITALNARMDRLISQFSAEGIISIELKVENVDKKVDDVKEAQTIQEYEALIERIPRVHARYNDTATKPSRPCHKGTRIGLLEGIIKWIEDEESYAPYLWLCGEVGVGKTTVAHTIAKEQEASKRLGASFFFSRHDRDRQSPHRLFPSLAYQLARFDRGIWRALAEVLKPDPDIVNRGLTEQFTKLVLEPLSKSGMASSRIVVIVIDGLDECSDPASVLDALALGIEDVSVRIRVLVCSRPYAAIQSKFKNTPLYHLASQNHFHDINPETLSNDVAAFLTWSLGEIASRPTNCHLPVPWPSKDQLDELIDRASGLFIIASTYDKYIDDPIEDNPAAQLNRILSRKRIVGSSPLAELDALYDQVLDDLKCTLKTGPELLFARNVIESVVLAYAGMSLDALAGLFCVDPSDARSVLRRLSAVILLPEVQTDAITPFHASFGEYIQDSTRCTIKELSVNTPHAHGRIADRCIATIELAARNGTIGVEEVFSSGVPLHLAYAGWHLATHLTSSSCDQACGDRMTIMECGIWTFLNLMYMYHGLEGINHYMQTASFKALLHVGGLSVDAETGISIGRLMITDHMLAINHTSEKSLAFATLAAVPAEGQRLHETQTVKSELSNIGESDESVASALNIVRDVRRWNMHRYPDMLVESVAMDLDSPRDVELRVLSRIRFQGICSLSTYLETKTGLDAMSRIHLVLNIAIGICHIHETSPLHAHGWLFPEYILVSTDGMPVFFPDFWTVPSPSDGVLDTGSLGDGDRADCIVTRRESPDRTFDWPSPEDTDPHSPDAQQRDDLWDFGSILYQITTGSPPLRRYCNLAKGHNDLGYEPELDEIPRTFWRGWGLKKDAQEARYKTALSLLLATMEEYEEVKAVLKDCWAIAPQDRPSMREVVKRLTAIINARRSV